MPDPGPVGGIDELWAVFVVVAADALVLRDRDADASSGNGLEERLYVLQDVNFNVTAVISTTPSAGEAVERYLYDPYGSVTVLDGDWGTDANGISDVAWTYLGPAKGSDTEKL